MRYIVFVVMVSLIFMAAGCVPSLHGLYSGDTLTFESSLGGRWLDDDENEIWRFSVRPDSSYELTYTKDGSTAQFDAHLLRLDGRLYLDTYPEEEISNDLLELHLVPAHIFGQLQMRGDSLWLSLLESEWLEKGIESGRISIGHEKVENGIVLTASTPDLQAFVRKYADDSEAWGEPAELHREK
jgi:hypothetical protein